MADTAACRILVLSSSTARGQQFVQRVKELSNTRNNANEGNMDTSLEAHPSGLSKLHAEVMQTEPAVSIPWTISNKYYTADVHFEVRTVEGFAGYLASEVPAIVYVWNHGEPYRTAVPELSKKLEHYDLEVSLAVRFNATSAGSNSAVVPEDDEEEEEEGLDEFLSSHGFEYVDGERRGRNPTQETLGSSEDEDDSGVPGLPRVIDALSTIMWPSLVQTPSTSSRKSRAGDLMDWARMEEDEAEKGTTPLVRARELLPPQQEKLKGRMQKEMDELERWLEEDVGPSNQERRLTHDHDDAWSTPHTTEFHDSTSELGFEDDFDEFVGAPTDVTYDQGRTSTQQSASNTAHSAYQSLEEHLGFDSDDPDLPSRAEIEEASRRIFGGATHLSPSSSSESWMRLHSPNVNANSSELPTTSATGETSRQSHSDFALPDDGDDDDFELGAFDLSKVLGALQGMKDEIAGIQDEGERRKAAARVALGLMYGLSKDDEH